MKKVVIAALAIVTALVLAACSQASSLSATVAPAAVGSSGDAPLRVTLITMDRLSGHWATMQQGAEEAVVELASKGTYVDCQWQSPEHKNSVEQIECIDNAVREGTQAIVIAPNDVEDCSEALRRAADAGVQLVYVDAVSDVPASATIATDNYNAGLEAGRQMRAELERRGVTEGTIGIVSAQEGVSTCLERIDGFESAFGGSAYTIGAPQHTDGSVASAQEVTASLVNDGIVGCYAVAENPTVGMGNVLSEAEEKGRSIVAVGFDNCLAARDFVRQGTLLSFIAQDPAQMGRLGIKAAVDAIEGVAGRDVETGSAVVSRDNVAEFESR